MENEDAGFRLAIKAITGLMTEQRRTLSLLEMQSKSTAGLNDQVELLGEEVGTLKGQVNVLGQQVEKLGQQVTVLGQHVGAFGQRLNGVSGQVRDLHQVQQGLVDSSERSLGQQQLLLEAMTGFADTSTSTQKRLARVEREIEELKRRFPEAS